MRKVTIIFALAAAVCTAQTGSVSSGPPVSFENSPRVHELMRAGNLYLSLQDALALAIENNLDVEIQRYGPPAAAANLLRAQGGGSVRGLNFTLAEVPAGVGGPLSPVLTNAAAPASATAGASVSTNALALGGLVAPGSNLSILGTVPQSVGSAIPNFDRALTGQLNWTHQSAPQTNSLSYGVPSLVTATTLANAGIQQGFASGALASFNFNNSRQSANWFSSQYNPYNGSSLGFTVTQPLLRGFGANLNRRFMRIAGNEGRIAGLLFQQQLVATAYGVVRLYTDLVALYEDEKVKADTVTLAEKLYTDISAEVEEGTLAPVEQTRAQAQVFSARQALINARGLLEEQEAVLKTVLTRRGNEDPEVRAARIIPATALEIPAQENIRPIQDLIQDALSKRPDLGQARLQIEDSRIGLAGAKNLTLPEIDLVGVMQNNGLAGPANPLAAVPNSTFVGGYGSTLEQIFARKYPTYGVGVQVTLPIHNRIAEADLARDENQVKQSQIRLREFENQARLEVEDALIAMNRARSSYEAAVQARKLQEESLAAEQARLEVGASTSFFVIQYQNLLAQARSTEVAAKSSYVKARAALQRATGSILDDNHISVNAALKGKAQP